MNIQLEHCDFCGKLLTIQKGYSVNNVAKKHGFCAEVGYSIGGWGRRQNFVPAISAELCNDCFNQVKPLAESLGQKINELRAKATNDISKKSVFDYTENETFLSRVIYMLSR